MLKHCAVVGMFFLSLAAMAQTPPSGMPQGFPKGMPGQADMQKMMLEAQRMATCMEGVDQKRLEALGREAEAVADEIDKLCAAGDEAGALRVGLDFAGKVNGDPTVQQVRECAAGMSEMVSSMVPQVYDESSAADSGRGICD